MLAMPMTRKMIALISSALASLWRRWQYGALDLREKLLLGEYEHA